MPVAAGAADAEVELEHVGLPGGQIDGAVAVEVADDREAAQGGGDDFIAGVDREAVVGVEIEVGAVEQSDFVAVGGVAVEVAGEGDAAGVECNRGAVLVEHGEAGGLHDERIGRAIVVCIQQPTEAGAHHRVGAVNAELGEAVGSAADSREVASEYAIVHAKLSAADQGRIELHGEG